MGEERKEESKKRGVWQSSVGLVEIVQLWSRSRTLGDVMQQFHSSRLRRVCGLLCNAVYSCHEPHPHPFVNSDSFYLMLHYKHTVCSTVASRLEAERLQSSRASHTVLISSSSVCPSH